MLNISVQVQGEQVEWDEITRSGSVGHSGKGGATQSFPYPKGTSEVCSYKGCYQEKLRLCGYN